MKRWLSNLVSLIWGRRPEPEALPPELLEMQRQYEEARAFEDGERLKSELLLEFQNEIRASLTPDFVRGLRDVVEERRMKAMG